MTTNDTGYIIAGHDEQCHRRWDRDSSMRCRHDVSLDELCNVATCSSLDHIWSVNAKTDHVEPGQKCLCGVRTWGVEFRPKKEGKVHDTR